MDLQLLINTLLLPLLSIPSLHQWANTSQACQQLIMCPPPGWGPSLKRTGQATPRCEYQLRRYAPCNLSQQLLRRDSGPRDSQQSHGPSFGIACLYLEGDTCCLVGLDSQHGIPNFQRRADWASRPMILAQQSQWWSSIVRYFESSFIYLFKRYWNPTNVRGYDRYATTIWSTC